jgi:hypothetical protein
MSVRLTPDQAIKFVDEVLVLLSSMIDPSTDCGVFLVGPEILVQFPLE